MAWERNLWLDLVQLCARAGFDRRALLDTADNEARMLCSVLATDYAAGRQVLQVYETG